MEPTTRFAIAAGIASGLAMVVTFALRLHGIVILAIYVAMVVVTIGYLRSKRVHEAARRFRIAITIYLVSHAIALVYVIVWTNSGALTRPWWKTAWPAAAMVATGIVVSTLIARFTEPKAAPQ